MTPLPSHIWFVRSNGGSGSYPVTPEGWRVVYAFIAGMLASGVAALVLAAIAPAWLGMAVFALGAIASAWYFIATARRHTDYSVTYSDWIVGRGPP